MMLATIIHYFPPEIILTIQRGKNDNENNEENTLK